MTINLPQPTWPRGMYGAPQDMFSRGDLVSWLRQRDADESKRAGDFLRSVADAWGADPDGWSHYVETDGDTRNLLRDLAEKLDNQHYDLN